MKCSHNIPFECRCQQCFQDALSRLRTMLDQPVPEATKEQKREFWGNVYRQALAETPKPVY